MRSTSGSGDVQGYKPVTYSSWCSWTWNSAEKCAGHSFKMQATKVSFSTRSGTEAALPRPKLSLSHTAELQNPQTNFSQDPIFHRGKYTAEGFLQHQMNISPEVESWMRHDEAVGSVGCRRRGDVNPISPCIPACQAVLLSTRPRGSAGLRSKYGT